MFTKIRLPTARFAILVSAAFILLINIANAQISGRIIEFDLSPISDAYVEIWDSYPDGITLETVLSDVDGNFCFAGLTEASYDLRVWKFSGLIESYFPSIILGIPQPNPGALYIRQVPVPELPGYQSPGLILCDFYDASSSSTYLGYPMRRGDVVGVRDPDGVWCGMLALPGPGIDGGYLVHVLGDNIYSGIDEGAIDGDTLSFYINNKSAEPIGGVGIWEAWVSKNLSLVGTSTDIEGVAVTGSSEEFVLPGESEFVQFSITNAGNHPDSYDLAVVSERGWTVALPGGSSSAFLNPGEAETITVTIDIPSLIPPDSTDDLFLFATSQSYYPAVGAGHTKIIAPNTCSCGTPWGDLNSDGIINPVDVVLIVNAVYLLNDLMPDFPKCPYDAGDINCDEILNPVDVVVYVNRVYMLNNMFCPDPCGE